MKILFILVIILIYIFSLKSYNEYFFVQNQTLNENIRELQEKSLDNKNLITTTYEEINTSTNTALECVFEADNEGSGEKKQTIKKTHRDHCESCQGSLIISDEGFLVCSNSKCGIIYTDYLDNSAEWRYYGAEDSKMSDPTRCGMPINPLLKESSYGCKVLSNGAASYEMRKIRRYNEWQSMPYKEKSIYEEFQKITIQAHNSNIPKIIIDEALRYHKMISNHKTFRGLNRDGILAASIYVACRVQNCPRTSKEIASIFQLDNTSATKGCKNALTIINDIENQYCNSDKTQLCDTRPNAFIERYCTKLNMNEELTKLCIFIALRIEKKNLIPENTPHSIASGIVYFVCQVCNLNITKRDVNRISEISEVTINKCYKKLDTLKEKLIPKQISDKYCS